MPAGIQQVLHSAAGVHLLLPPLIHNGATPEMPAAQCARGEAACLGQSRPPVGDGQCWGKHLVLTPLPPCPRIRVELSLWAAFPHSVSDTETQRGSAACSGSHSNAATTETPSPESQAYEPPGSGAKRFKNRIRATGKAHCAPGEGGKLRGGLRGPLWLGRHLQPVAVVSPSTSLTLRFLCKENMAASGAEGPGPRG